MLKSYNLPSLAVDQLNSVCNRQCSLLFVRPFSKKNLGLFPGLITQPTVRNDKISFEN